MKKPRISRSLRALAALLASAAFGVFMTFAVALACNLWSIPNSSYMAYRISSETGSLFSAQEAPPGVSLEDWRAGKWVMYDVHQRFPNATTDPNPSPVERFEQLEALADNDWGRQYQHAGIFGREEALTTSRSFGTRIESLTMGYMASDVGYATVRVVSAGWPAYCLQGSTYHYQPGWQMAPPDLVRDFTDVPSWVPRWIRRGPGQQLPIGIRPIAVALDILFWAAIPNAAVLASRFLRRLHRKHRGRCLSCGYDQRGLPPATPCPECGQPARAMQANPACRSKA